MNRHRLVVSPEAIRKDYDSTSEYPVDSRSTYMGMWQLSRLTGDRGALPHDDRLEALAIGVRWFVDQMALDEDKEIEHTKHRALEDSLRRFLEEDGMWADGLGPARLSQPSWV